MHAPRRLALASACAAVLTAALAATLAATPALAQHRAASAHRDPGVSGPVSGTIRLSARGAAAGVGYTWGDGVLSYGARKYPFSVSGISVADIGFSRIHGHGRVYNLHRLQDFSGTYVAATGEATLGTGIGGRIMQNAHGVQIRVDEVTNGARLQGSADGIKLTLR